MSYDMVSTEYDKLYAKYVDKGAGFMFDLALADMKIDVKNYLDLCSGSNAICLVEALNRREDSNNQCFVENTVVDLNECVADHIPYDESDGVIRIIEDVGHFVKGEYHRSSMPNYKHFQLITCRQGINYWFHENAMVHVSSLLDAGGVFIFNTFWNIPSSVPIVKEYTLHGMEYVEVSVLHDTLVYHSQYATGMQPHHTKFLWVPPEQFIKACERSFSHVSAHFDGNSMYMRCQA